MLPYLTSTSAYKKRGAKKVKISAAAAADFFIQFVSVSAILFNMYNMKQNLYHFLKYAFV